MTQAVIDFCCTCDEWNKNKNIKNETSRLNSITNQHDQLILIVFYLQAQDDQSIYSQQSGSTLTPGQRFCGAGL